MKPKCFSVGGIAILLFFAATVFSQGQECGTKVSKTLNYKILARKDISAQILSLGIYVEPKHLNIEDMLLLARQFRNLYCDKSRLLIWIFDTKTKKPHLDYSLPYPLPLDKPIIRLPNGLYELNRKEKIESLEFLTPKKDGKWEEIEVVFKKNTICITKEAQDEDS